MDIKYGRAWRKGPTGLETGIDLAGDRHIVNIAHGNEEVWQLLTFLQQTWPALFAKWLTFHPEAHPILTEHAPPQSVSIQWAEKVWKFESRTRRGNYHVVTLSKGRFSCNCEAFMYGNVCWAIKKAQQEEGAAEGQ